MEDVKVIQEFLRIRNSGDGYGDGSGYGYGYGLKEYNGEIVWYIDGVPTLIDHIHSDYAKGRIVNDDLTNTPCYIARVENSFAHGTSLKAAYADAEEKAMEEMPLEERLTKFKTEFPSLQCSATCATFYKWHHILTVSCTMGRDHFVQSHGLDMEKDYTVAYFLSITEDAFGCDAIRKLKEMYNNGSQTPRR